MRTWSRMPRVIATRPGVFASGDVVLGARTVVEAVAYSKVVAEAMDRYLQNLPKEKTEA